MRRISTFFCASLLGFFSASAQASATQGPFGLGIVLGSPTGLTGNYYYQSDRSVAASLGWGGGDFTLNVDHLWYRKGLVTIDGIGIDVLLGLGLHIDDDSDRKDRETSVGVRFPVGLSYMFKKVPLQLYGELVPTLILVDSSDLTITAAIGGRYYF